MTSIRRLPSVSRNASPALPHFIATFLALLVVSLSSAGQAHASDSWRKFNEFASGSGNLLYLGGGTLLPLVTDGPDGREHTVTVATALATSVAASELMKLTFREKRPDSTSRDSFPSGHATAAFAVASVQSQYHPRQAALWYTGATIIAASRVSLHRHYVHDVIAGAALGYVAGRMAVRHSEERGNRWMLLPDAGFDAPVGLRLHREF